MPCWPPRAEGAGSGPHGRCQRCPPCPSSSASLPTPTAARLHQPLGRACFPGQEGGGEGPCGHPCWAACGGPPWPPFCSGGAAEVLHCWEGSMRSPWLLQLQRQGRWVHSVGRDSMCLRVCMHTHVCAYLLPPSRGATAVVPPALHPPSCLGPLVVICSSKC